jgi:hypothetical protein
MSLKDYIKDKRPSLSASSITTYNSILTSLYKKVFDKKEIDVKDFSNTEKIIHFLKDLPANKRKTILSALVVITDEKKYREMMMEDVKEYNDSIKLQEKTETQKENWVTGGELGALYDALKHNADLLYKKKVLTPADLQEIQNYIIISLYCGKFIPPRRAVDYTAFKISNIKPDEDNYMEKNQFIFNKFKTSKCYGKQTVDIDAPLKKIMKKWIGVNPTDWLLFDVNNNPLSSVKLNQRLNKLFGKKASINALRHTYLTDKYAKTSEENKALSKDMTEMGSSKNMADTYIKLS